jgi:hypothetical protein
MRSILNIVLTAVAAALIGMSIKQGLDFGLTADGPLVQGYVGGLFSTVAAMIGTLIFVYVYNDIKD